MLKKKYLLTAALVALCVALAPGVLFAADAWSVTAQSFPSALVWEASGAASVTAQNDGTAAEVWDDTYELWSVEGNTASATLIDRWGLDAVPIATGTTVPVAGTYTFALNPPFTVTAPPMTTDGTGLQCGWILSDGSSLIMTDIATANIVISRFPDIQPGTPGAWARTFIEHCASRVPLIVQGYPNGLFGPTGVVSRDQMAVFLRNTLALTPTSPATPTFGDVDTDYWAYSDIETLYEAGIVQGYGDGNYHPEYSVSRGQMAVFIANAAGWALDTPTTDVFPDVPLGFWCDDQVLTCVNQGIVSGYNDGYYRPSWTVSRDQMAVFVYKTFIGSTDSALLVAGPGVTDVNVGAASWVGFSTYDTDPDYAYATFDAAHLGSALDGNADTNWTVRFDFRGAATPTVPGTIVNVNTAAASLPPAGTYFSVSTAVPGLASGSYVLVVFVEDKAGNMNQVVQRRTVAFTIS